MRERQQVKTGKTSQEVSYALASLPSEQAAPTQIAALILKHWHIKTRLHYVRELTYDEERSRVLVGALSAIWPP